MERVELSLHSTYSSMRGVLPPEKILEYTDFYNMAAVALTDLESVQGYGEMAAAAKKYPDLKILYGIETWVIDDRNAWINDSPLNSDNYYLVSILIRNEQGKGELLAVHLLHFYVESPV